MDYLQQFGGNGFGPFLFILVVVIIMSWLKQKFAAKPPAKEKDSNKNKGKLKSDKTHSKNK